MAVLDPVYVYTDGTANIIDGDGNNIGQVQSIEYSNGEPVTITVDGSSNIQWVESERTYNENGDLLIGGIPEDELNGLMPEYQGQHTITIPPSGMFEDKSVTRVREFYAWLQEEQKDLEEECGADLSALVDKLEEMFPELSGENEELEVRSPPVIDFNDDFQHFRRNVESALRVDAEDINHERDYSDYTLNDII